jgi:hypothetical protein
MNELKEVDVNALPVHLFVKSQKEAKKIRKESSYTADKPGTFRKAKRFEA